MASLLALSLDVILQAFVVGKASLCTQSSKFDQLITIHKVDLDDPILVSGNQKTAIRAKLDTINQDATPGNGTYAFAGRKIPDENFSVLSCTYQSFPRWGQNQLYKRYLGDYQ